MYSVGEDLVSSRFPRNPVSGRSGRYKIGPYTGMGDANDAVTNEMAGTRPAATTAIYDAGWAATGMNIRGELRS